MEKPKSMCLIMDSAAQIVILSTLTQHRPYLEMRYFWAAIPFHQCGDLYVRVKKTVALFYVEGVVKQGNTIRVFCYDM